MLERRLLEEFNSHYRRIWVQETTLSKRRKEYSVVITLFPLQGTYGMLFSGVLNEVTFDNLSTLIENHLDMS